jgi:hypothetical protein
MTTGDGVFAGLLVVGLVWLYVATKDRWRWKRIFIRACLVLAVPVVGIAAWLGYTKWDESQARVADGMWDLKLGDSSDDVVLKKGKPSQQEPDKCIGDNKQCMLWVYVDGELGYMVELVAGKVRSIQAITTDGNEFRLPGLQGISNYSSPDSVEAKFGKPDVVTSTADKTRQLANFSAYRVVFAYEKNRVVSVGVFDPGLGPLRYIYTADKNK